MEKGRKRRRNDEIYLKIFVFKESGFIQLKQGKTVTDTDPYEGLCIDMIKRMAQDLHFNYTLELVPGGEYGSYDPVSKKWTGMVGELVAEVSMARPSDHGEICTQVDYMYIGRCSPSDVHTRQVENYLIMVRFVLR